MEINFSAKFAKTLNSFDELLIKLETLSKAPQANIELSDAKSIKDEYKILKNSFKKDLKLVKSSQKAKDDATKLYTSEICYNFHLKSQKYFAFIKNEIKENSHKDKAELFFKKKLKSADKIQIKNKTKTSVDEAFQGLDKNNKNNVNNICPELIEVENLLYEIDEKLIEMKYQYSESNEEEYNNDRIFQLIGEKINKISVIEYSLEQKQRLFELLEQKRERYRLLHCFHSKNCKVFEEIIIGLNRIYSDFDKDFIPESIKKIKNLTDQIFFSSIDIDDILQDKIIFGAIEEEYNHLILTFEGLLKQDKELNNNEETKKNFDRNCEVFNTIKIIVGRVVNMKKKFVMEFFLENKNYEILFRNFLNSKNKFLERKKRLLLFFHPDKNKFEYLNKEETQQIETLANEFFGQINQFVQSKSKDFELIKDFAKADKLLEEALSCFYMKLEKEEVQGQSNENNLNDNDYYKTNKTIFELTKIMKEKSEIAYEIYQEYLDVYLNNYLDNNKKEQQRNNIIMILNKITNCLIIQGEETLAKIYNLFALKENTYPYQVIEDLKNESGIFYKRLELLKNKKAKKADSNNAKNYVGNIDQSHKQNSNNEKKGNNNSTAIVVISNQIFMQDELHNKIYSFFFQEHLTDSKYCIDIFKIKRKELDHSASAVGTFIGGIYGFGYVAGGAVIIAAELGGAAVSGGAVAGGAIAGGAVAGGAVAGGAVLVGGIFVVIGLCFCGLAIVCCVDYFKSKQFKKKKEISEKLQKIFDKAFKFYEEGKDEEFINEISQKFNNEEKLFDTEEIKDKGFDYEKFSKKLLKYLIKPQSIASLLNIIADIFLRRKVDLGYFFNSYDEGKKILQWLIRVEKNILYQECEKMDKELAEIKSNKKSFHYSLWRELKDFIIVDYDKEYNQHKLFEEYSTYFYTQRYEQTIIIAEINLAIANILSNDYIEASKLILDILEKYDTIISLYPSTKKKVNIVIMFYKLYLKRNLLKEGKNQAKYNSEFNNNQNPHDTEKEALFKHKDEYLNELELFLHNATDRAEKSVIYSQIAGFWEAKFDKQPNQLIRSSVKYLKEAYSNYELSLLNLASSESNILATLGKARVMVKMNDFEKALLFLKDSENYLKDLDELYYLKMISYRKTQQEENFYQEVKKYEKLNPGLSMKMNSQINIDLIKKEIRLANDMKHIIENLKDPLHKDYDLTINRNSHKTAYTGISINGGGSRGIMEAIMLKEIERDSNKPISCLANNISGTSTGGLIAGALSLPDKPNSLKPKFRASDIVDLYENKTRLIFAEKNFWISTLFSKPKFRDTGRSKLFKEYFGERRIAESLTDLIITAVNDKHLDTTFCFNRREALISNQKNFSYYDALMATSSAPTFFQAHEIRNVGFFYDGGVQANNPSEIVYREFNNYHKDKYEKLFILNLGSGYCVTDSLNPSGSRQGALFWAKNLVNVTLPNQEVIVNENMYTNLNENYQSWQIALPSNKEISLDACGKEDIDKMIYLAYEYIETLKNSESNIYQKTIDFLLNNESMFTI